MSEKHIEHLKVLKKKLEEGKMSAMVGAGFSQNANKKFPNWGDLLEDLVLELYEDEINYKFKNEVLYHKNTNIDKKKFIDNEIERIVNKNGYLNLVSEYIKKKGYREAITLYIEKRIKKIDENEDNDLTLHKNLLALPWNNVYTTNYDTLLEKSYAGKRDKLEEITSEKKKTQKLIDKFKNEKEELEAKLKDNNVEEKNLEDNKKYDTKQINEEEVMGEVEEKDTIIENHQKKYKELEDQYKKIKKNIYEIVDSSEKLAIGSNKLLVKLHGTLRKEDDKFGFDNNNKKQYVIANEDYDNYPKQHEAFTQLMRISLLQESFCLFGFSGDDPNFNRWISWVRDILDNGNSNDNRNSNYKIFLLGVSKDDPEEDKKLFYENHRIGYIPLMNDEVKEFLTDYQIEESENNIKQLFLNFLNYLDTDDREEKENDIDNSNKKKQENYISYWEKTEYYPGENVDLGNVLDIYKNLKKLKIYNRIPNPKLLIYSYNQITSKNFSKYLEETKDFKERVELFGLLSLAINSDFSTLSNFNYNIDDLQNEFNFINYDKLEGEEKTDWQSFALVLLKDFRISQEKDNFNYWLKKLKDKKKELNIEQKNRLKYEKLLFLAFEFDYQALKKELKSWNLTDEGKLHWRTKKAGLMILTGEEISEIIEYLTVGEEILFSKGTVDRLYYYDFLYYLNYLQYLQTQTESTETKKDYFDKKVKEIADKGFYRINDYFEKILVKIDNKKEKIEPFDKKRSRYSKTITFGGSIKYKDRYRGLQLTSFLLEIGLPLKVNNMIVIDKEKWVSIFKVLYKAYPYVSIFLSSHYMGEFKEEFIRRIGQEITRPDNLECELENIYLNLVNGYNYFKNNGGNRNKNLRGYLFCIAEIIKALPYQTWRKFFEDFWIKHNTDKIKEILFPEGNSSWSYYIFLERALPLIEDEDILEKIILELLDIDSKQSTKFDYLSYLSSNYFIRDNIKIFKNNQKIRKKIKNIILGLKNPDTLIMNLELLFDIRYLLTENNKIEILEILKDIDNLSLIINRAWIEVIYFSNGNDELQRRLKYNLLNEENDHIWNTGIKFRDDGWVSRTGTRNFIPINKTIRTEQYKRGVEWIKREVKVIYKRLVDSLEEIIEFETDSRKYDDIDLLQKMSHFLENEAKKLEDIEDFEEVYNKVLSRYKKQRGFNKIADGILADEGTSVIMAIVELRRKIERKTLAKCKLEWQFLINKIILKKEPEFEFSISFLANAIIEYKDKDEFKSDDFIKSYKLILSRFWNDPMDGFERSFVEERVVKIAMVLDYWDIEDEYIYKWLNRKENSRFTNVRKVTLT